MNEVRQMGIGLGLAAAVMGTWLALHIVGVFVLRPQGIEWLLYLPLVALICWLNVGLFIIAHDAMHGSLAPRRPALNRWIGRIALFVYAGFSYDRLLPKHHAHHRHPGTEHDPDFSADHPRHFWPWYLAFFRQYFGLREFAVLTAAVAVYVFVLRAPYANLLLFWALPAILSSLQLFYFGTYLPHRHEEAAFADHHHARTNDYSWVVSLLTCFHFGYHHEHHRAPHLPWWKLPSARLPEKVS